MKVTYLIGNGFDLNVGLETKYTEFYEYYLKCHSSDAYINEFKKELSKNKELQNWSDLEIVLGQYASRIQNDKLSEIFNTKDDTYISLLDDIQENLSKYLQGQDGEFSISDEDRKKLHNDLVFFDGYLNQRDQAIFAEYKNKLSRSSYEIRVAVFNYTHTFEKMYGWKGSTLKLGGREINGYTYTDYLYCVEHIHGTTTEDMILGVNDPSQINSSFLRNSKKTIRAIVKPEMNINAGTMRDERCKQYINESDVICIYGMSLGATDKYWWNLIVDRLASSNARLVVFSYSKDINAIRGYRSRDQKDALIDKLLSYSNLDDEIKAKIAERIFVCFNSSIFKANIERHLPNEKDNEFMINGSKQASKIAKASEAMEKYYDLTK
jgi:hypothetical protein